MYAMNSRLVPGCRPSQTGPWLPSQSLEMVAALASRHASALKPEAVAASGPNDCCGCPVGGGRL